MWTFSDSKDHSDTAYTKDFLPAHTDNTYFNDGAGLQVLHCIQHSGEFYIYNTIKQVMWIKEVNNNSRSG
jgi:hypothetical protein